jgi:hypothetical protein
MPWGDMIDHLVEALFCLRAGRSNGNEVDGN